MRTVSIFLHSFVALSAIISSYGLVVSNGLGIPQEWIAGSFGSYVIPGLVLGFIIGGTNLFAVTMEVKRSQYAAEATATAAFGILIWLFVQMYLIQQSSWLQTLYFVVAITMLVILLCRMKYGDLKTK